MSIQLTELHFRSTPVFDAAAIAERAEALIHSGIELSKADDRREALLFFHTRHAIEYRDGTLPAQTAILASERPAGGECHADAIQQSWACSDARERLQRCTTSRIVTEVMARHLEPADRLMLFHGVLQAVVELTEPEALVFLHSQQVVAPEKYLTSCDKVPARRWGTINVRFFRVSRPGQDEMIMDTRGLDEIGLHDLQCHFRDLDPNDVSGLLISLADYLVEHGPVIESGHTVAGIEQGSRWTCQFENSLLEPKRELLDLNPGLEHAGGNRQQG